MERRDPMYDAREVIDAGAHLSLSSDWPVAGYLPTHRPLVTIQVAVTGQFLTEPRGEPMGG